MRHLHFCDRLLTEMHQLVFGMYGDHIGLLLGSCQQPALGYDRIVVWDWKNGGMAVRILAFIIPFIFSHYHAGITRK
jgi:hypothetical protein